MNSPKATRTRRQRRSRRLARLLSGVDLVIDVATLGEYGLEPLPAEGPCQARPAYASVWEAPSFGRDRRGSCGHAVSRPADHGAALRRFAA